MTKKQNSNKKLIAPVIIFLILLLMGFIFYTQYAHSRDLKAELEKLDMEIAENNKTILSLEDLKSRLENSGDTVRIYDELLPQNPDKSLLMSFFQELAVNSNVELTKIIFDPEVPKEGYTEIPVKLTYTGSYDSLAELIHSMDQGKRLICIDSITMKNVGTGITKVNLELSVRAFYMNK